MNAIKKCIEKNTARKYKENIVDKLDEIQDIDTLQTIDNYIEECKPLNLHTYINVHFDGYHPEIKKALEHEVRRIYLDIERIDKFEPTDAYINHFCELYVQGHCLDIWIAEYGSIFSSYELANIIFQLWTKEIVFQ